MRVIVAECSVIYEGRGSTSLEKATRAIIWKTDGSVSIHSDFSNKPLNYMGGKKILFDESLNADGVPVWRFEARNESITVILYKIISDTSHVLSDVEPGLVRDGTEAHLQEWLSEHPEVLNLNIEKLIVEREFQTGAGAVDLLCYSEDKSFIMAVEVKRTALLGVVYQTVRYVDALKEMFPSSEVKGMVAALDIRPNTFKLLEKKGLSSVTVQSDWKEIP